LDHRGFANARFTDDQDEAAVPAASRGQLCSQSFQFPLAADKTFAGYSISCHLPVIPASPQFGIPHFTSTREAMPT
jgi:hypothetical protein